MCPKTELLADEARLLWEHDSKLAVENRIQGLGDIQRVLTDNVAKCLEGDNIWDAKRFNTDTFVSKESYTPCYAYGDWTASRSAEVDNDDSSHALCQQVGEMTLNNTSGNWVDDQLELLLKKILQKTERSQDQIKGDNAKKVNLEDLSEGEAYFFCGIEECTYCLTLKPDYFVFLKTKGLEAEDDGQGRMRVKNCRRYGRGAFSCEQGNLGLTKKRCLLAYSNQKNMKQHILQDHILKISLQRELTKLWEDNTKCERSKNDTVQEYSKMTVPDLVSKFVSKDDKTNYLPELYWDR
jgi:hypothetical protein